MRRYSIGVFFDAWTNDEKQWIKQSNFIKRLNGIEHVEIMLEYVDLTPKQITTLKRLLETYKIVLHAPFMNLSILSPHKEIVDASLNIYKKAARIGKQLGANIMTFHIETYPNFYTEEKVKTLCKQIINRLSTDTNMKIAIENLSYGGNTRISYPWNPKQVYSLSKILSANIGFTVDVGHFLHDEFDSIKVIKKLKDRIFDIHLHDGFAKKAHLDLGKGALDLNKFLLTLQENNYSGFLTIEVLGRKDIASSWDTLTNAINNL